MPKAAAPSPSTWATVHGNFKKFDINELNRVVLDYAQVELEAAARKRQRSGLTKVGAGLIFWVALIGLCGPLIAAGVFLSGGGLTKFSEDFSAGVEVPFIYIGCALGAVSILYFLVPWLQESHRQWNRNLVGFSVILLISTVLLLVLILVSDPEAYPRFPLLLAPVVLLVLEIVALVAAFRLYSKEKPPAVDVTTLSSDDLEVLLASRHRALTTLRARSIVSYDEFDELDRTPLFSTDGRA
ncbi:hypothetical protein [Nocardioides luteus]|uniref:Uncharacterized protein n=1 Tax=Nocardioides luteus TaxID=1844 RepID=A0A1J4N340_9ACTN|nr:hypothetical protein [Nocardioides luteus]OIJ25375.1 hypothetical protein UG56_018375 [Nocardioides luteus]